MHLWWQAVHDAAPVFGPTCYVPRIIEREPPAPVDWYVSHISGCLATFVVKLDEPRIEQAAKQLQVELFAYWQSRNWQNGYDKRRIRLGQPADGEGGDDAPF